MTTPFDRDKWDRRFLKIAREGATWSKDPSTQVGAVIVDQANCVVSLGYNGLPRGVSDRRDRLDDRLKKYAAIPPPVPQRIAPRPATSPAAALTMIAWYVRPARCGNAVTGLSTALWRGRGAMAGSARGSGARWRGVRQVGCKRIKPETASSRRW